ncbi:MAG: flavodoxin family protein [Chloroflexota bacterium]
MKALGIVGSPRKNGNTDTLMKHTLKAIAAEGLETELVRLADYDIRPCDGCQVCRQGKPCPIDDDLMTVYRKALASDAVIIGAPVYFGSANSLTKAFLERTGAIDRPGAGLRGKVGGPLVVARRAGKTFTFAEIMYWFHILGFFMPGSSYWNVAVGREKGEVRKDTEGMETAWNFGKNVAFLVKKLQA